MRERARDYETLRAFGWLGSRWKRRGLDLLGTSAARGAASFGAAFPLVSLGSRDDLRMYNAKERAAHPEGEREI